MKLPLAIRPLSLALLALLPTLAAQAADPAPAATERPVHGRAAAAGTAGGRAWWAPVADRGWLGIRMATRPDAERALAAEQMPDEWLKVPNLEWLTQEWDGRGSLVLEVFAETPAEKAGLLPGDVIVSFNGIRTQSPGELAFIVQRAVVGRDGEIEVLRDGETRPLLVEVGMHPEDARRLAEEKEAARAAAAAEGAEAVAPSRDGRAPVPARP